MDIKNKILEERLVSIVDDDYLMRRSIWRLLRSAGLRAEAFPSAGEFLISRSLAETACLVLDLRMPAMGGLELQRRLIGDGRRIPIIFITAHEDPESRVQATRAGAADFLLKPFSEEGLLLAVRSALKISSGDEGKIP
jgi:FixJ family two-component response regulator